VYRGDVYVHPAMARSLVSQYLEERPSPSAAGDGLARLTRREREVLQLVARGYTNQQIADRLFVSVKTIETHRAHIMQKLELHSRAELVRFALDRGLLAADEEGS
jgi:two-component system response regulator NreC